MAAMTLVELFESIHSTFEKRDEALRLLQINLSVFGGVDKQIVRVNGPYMSVVSGRFGDPNCTVVYTANIEYHNKPLVPSDKR